MDSFLVLIVDDDSVNRQLMKGVLKKKGFTFIEAGNGQEAVDLALEHLPDVILMDAMMPVMDGYTATGILKTDEKTRRIPVVMITALSEKEDKLRAIECGVDDFISKPIDAIELVTRCKSLAKTSKLNKEYILATKNPNTECLNRTALLNDINEMSNPLLLMFLVENFDNVHELHSIEFATVIEKMLIERIEKHLKDAGISFFEFYHIYDGEYAAIIDLDQLGFEREDIRAFVPVFSNIVRKLLINVDEEEFEANIVVGAGCCKGNIYINTTYAVKYARRKRQDYAFASDVQEETHNAVLDNIKWVKKLRTALENDNIVPFFQGIYDHSAGAITKYECLARLVDEDGKVYTPYFFLEVAKKSKYYSEITKMIISKAIEAFKDRTESVSINLALQDIASRSTRSFILSKLAEYPELSGRVNFEILEDENTDNFEVILDFVSEIKKHGASVYIDDFGSGFSNFQRLLELKPDVIKIDGSLIKDIDKSQDRQNIVETIVAFAKKAGIATVAEFVENESIYNVVKSIGIEYSQGYHFSKPGQF